jgi:hypothetical protein
LLSRRIRGNCLWSYGNWYGSNRRSWRPVCLHQASTGILQHRPDQCPGNDSLRFRSIAVSIHSTFKFYEFTWLPTRNQRFVRPASPVKPVHPFRMRQESDHQYFAGKHAINLVSLRWSRLISILAGILNHIMVGGGCRCRIWNRRPHRRIHNLRGRCNISMPVAFDVLIVAAASQRQSSKRSQNDIFHSDPQLSLTMLSHRHLLEAR